MKTNTPTPPPANPPLTSKLLTLQERYAEVYAWVKAQPCVSYDFVQVPIESLAELLHVPNEITHETKKPVAPPDTTGPL